MSNKWCDRFSFILNTHTKWVIPLSCIKFHLILKKEKYIETLNKNGNDFTFLRFMCHYIHQAGLIHTPIFHWCAKERLTKSLSRSLKWNQLRLMTLHTSNFILLICFRFQLNSGLSFDDKWIYRMNVAGDTPLKKKGWICSNYH